MVIVGQKTAARISSLMPWWHNIRTRAGPDPHALGLAVPGSWDEQPLARTLERAVGLQMVVERAGWEVAELASDIGNRAVRSAMRLWA